MPFRIHHTNPLTFFTFFTFSGFLVSRLGRISISSTSIFAASKNGWVYEWVNEWARGHLFWRTRDRSALTFFAFSPNSAHFLAGVCDYNPLTFFTFLGAFFACHFVFTILILLLFLLFLLFLVFEFLGSAGFRFPVLRFSRYRIMDECMNEWMSEQGADWASHYRKHWMSER